VGLGRGPSRPGDKYLARTLKPASTKKFGQGEGSVSLPLTGKGRERGKDRLGFFEFDIDLAAVATMPAEGSAAKSLRRLLADQKQKFEAVGQTERLELGGAGECVSNAAVVERTAEAGVSRTLRSHERMFAHAARYDALPSGTPAAPQTADVLRIARA
jgi:hypothetical protein